LSDEAKKGKPREELQAGGAARSASGRRGDPALRRRRAGEENRAGRKGAHLNR
jgi:hypothetical protein